MAWNKWAAVPPDERMYLENLVTVWEQTIGYQVPFSVSDMLALANGQVITQHDLGQFVQSHWDSRFGTVLQNMPWALYGLDKDSYAAMSETFSTEYKKITGQDISPDALQQAFQNPRDPTGGLLNASQYQQQLMNDAAIQKQFGWVRYGMDFAAWTQQKLADRMTFGRDIRDAEAATILQYTKTSAGANMAAIGRSAGQQTGPPPATGVAGSFAR